MEPKICQRCSLDFYDDSDDFHNLEICTYCGYTQNSHHNTTEAKSNRFTLKGVFALTLFLFTFIAFTANWVPFFFASLPPRTKALIGVASAEDYSRLARMCDTLKKYDCVEEMLTEKVEVNPKDLEAWSELGVLQYQRRNFNGAIQSLERYAQAGGKDTFTNYIYAKALSEVGRIDEASAQYKKILASKPHTLQTTVARNYVEMLIRNGRDRQAKQVIALVRRKGSSASDFMKNELRSLASVK